MMMMMMTTTMKVLTITHGYLADVLAPYGDLVCVVFLEHVVPRVALPQHDLARVSLTADDLVIRVHRRVEHFADFHGH